MCENQFQIKKGCGQPGIERVLLRQFYQKKEERESPPSLWSPSFVFGNWNSLSTLKVK